jgi:hypothetical protein
MELLLALLGALSGVCGLIVGTISLLKQRKMEARFSEKERMGELAGRLMEITMNNNRLIALIRDLSADKKHEKQAVSIAQDAVTKAFDSKAECIVVESHIEAWRLESTPEGDIEFRPLSLNGLEEPLIYDTLVSYGGMMISSKVKDSPEGHDFFILTNVLSEGLKAPDRLREFELLIEEFSPSLFEEFCDAFRSVITKLVENVLESEEIEVIPADFDKIGDIAAWIYHGILGYESLSSYLDKLEEVNNRLKELRKRLVMMKYS